MPPEAPLPITTTSAISVLDLERQVLRVRAALELGEESPALEAQLRDEAGFRAVVAVDRELLREREEGRAGRLLARRARGQPLEHLVLMRRVEPRERCAVELPAPAVEPAEPRAELLLPLGRAAREHEVDVLVDERLPGSRRVG